MKLHVHSEKAGLIINVVQSWPVSWLTNDAGDPFNSMAEAVEAIINLPTKFVPMGCPSPDGDGKCPGH